MPGKMNVNLLEPTALLAAVQMIPRDTRLLVKRYFPTNDDKDIFNAKKVVVEYRDGKKKIAPAVVDRSSGVVVQRQGYKAIEMEPLKISVKRPLTLDDVSETIFAENPFNPKSPQEREQELLAEDLIELSDMIDRKEEQLAAQLLLTNSLDVDLMDAHGKITHKYNLKFYDGDEPDNVYTPTKKWTDPEADILGDLRAMVQMLSAKGLPASELLVSEDVADAITSNERILKLLDNRRVELGHVEPSELTDSSSVVCTLNIRGRNIDVISYCETYTDDNDQDVPYLPEGTAIMLAPNCGHKVYGAISQVEQSDGAIHTYPLPRVPKYLANPEGESRSFQMSAKTILMPNAKNAWIVGNVMPKEGE